MNSKKKTKSFAEALIAADVPEEVLLPKKTKLIAPKRLDKDKRKYGADKIIRDKNTNSKDKITNTKDKDTKTRDRNSICKDKNNKDKSDKSSSSKHKRKDDGSKSRVSTTSSCKDSRSSKSKHKTDRRSSSCSTMTDPFDMSSNKSASLTESDDESDSKPDDHSHIVTPSCLNKDNIFSANRKGASDKYLAKILKEEEKSIANAKMLDTVDDDLMLFDLQLKDDAEIELPQQVDCEEVPSVAPGIPLLHSLSCHKLYTLDKVVWPFSPLNSAVLANKTDKCSRSCATTIRWLGGLATEEQVRSVLLSRVLMDQHLGVPVMGPLFKYLIRYIAASVHQKVMPTTIG